MEIIQEDIKNIKPYERNAKKHPKRQVRLIADSIREFGMNQPLVVDKDNVIIVGHGRFEAAKLLGMSKVPILKVNLSEEQAKAYRLADNKLNESDWEMELVIDELKGLSSEMLNLTGFDSDLLLEPENKDDQIPEKVPARAKLGDIYALGDHRIICGDSTQPEAILTLLDGKKADMCFCDPPYNIDYAGGTNVRGTNKERKIQNDKMSKDGFYEFLKSAIKQIIDNTDGVIYICMSSSELDTLKKSFEDSGGHWSSFIIWVKNNFTMSRADYQNTYEPILYGWPERLKNHYFIDQRNLSNVWEDLSSVKAEFDGQFTTITFQGFKVKLWGKVEKGSVIKKKQRMDIMRHDKPIKSAEHPTMKPVSLVVEAITNSSKEGGAVLDTFLGSGTTLIACEKTGRVCYGCELDPAYIDVIIKRWEDYTGLKAKKL